jgi:LCP family protein required for cell wall assembly
MDEWSGRHAVGPIPPEPSRHLRRTGGSYRLVALRSGRVLAATISAALLVGTGYGAYNYDALTAGQQTIVVDGLGGPRPSTAAGGSTQHVDGSAENILIVGDDSRAGLTAAQESTLQVGSDSGTTSTDTLLLVHVPGNGKQATMVSIPRDSYVDIPGFSKSKINAAYVDGYDYTSGATTAAQRQRAGIDELVATVKELTGVTIDHYVQVGFEGFEAIAKAIGGVSVNLCHAVDDTVAYNLAHGEGAVGSGFQMSAGVHKLTPVQTLEFVRQRHNLPGDDGDIGREARQRYFLSAAFSKILSAGVLLNPIRLHDLINAINGAFITDQNFQLLDFAQQMSDLSKGNITGETIPYTNGPTISGVGSVLLVDPVQVQLRIQQLFYGATAVNPSSPSTPRSTSPSTPSRASSAPTVAPVAAPACIN